MEIGLIGLILKDINMICDECDCLGEHESSVYAGLAIEMVEGRRGQKPKLGLIVRCPIDRTKNNIP